MKNEIKEILEGIKVVIKHDGTLEFNAKELNILLDYITNLQEEYRQTKLLKERYQLEKEDYKSRIDEAIEKLKFYNDKLCNMYVPVDIVLNILNGSDE